MVADLSEGKSTLAWNNFVLHSDPQAEADEFRKAAIANQFMGVANNGGLNAFLTASHDLDAAEVYRALIGVGAHQAASALGGILDALGEALPVATPDDRWASLDRLWQDRLDGDDVLTKEADEELLDALERHVAANQEYYLQLSA